MSFCPAMPGSANDDGSSDSNPHAGLNPLEGVVPHEYQGLLFWAGLSTVTYPLENAKILIQLGHEPISPRQVKTFFGRPALQLPSVFKYVATIKQKDGFLALYRGWAPKMTSMGLGHVVRKRFDEFWPEKAPKDPTKPTPEEIVDGVSRQCAERMACLIATHPLHVCTVRAVAQFVGKEDKYDGVLGAIVAIYKEDGILGYYAGFIPRALGELASICLTAAAAYAINTYLLPDDQSIKAYADHLASFFASSLTYPFTVVGNCMAVSHSGLAASYPPHMPLYQNWVDAWSHLSRKKQLKRGSSLFFRYYTGPQVIVGDRAFPIS